MRAKKASPNVPGGRLWACLILAAVLLSSLMVGPRPSDAAVSSREFPVSLNPENETSAALGGNTAVWVVSRAGSGLDVQGKNLSTGLDLLIPPELGPQARPSVSGRTVVWEDTSSGDPDVYGYDTVTRQKFPVAVGPGYQGRPSVSGRTVVWEDDRGGDSDVYRLDLNADFVTGQESPVVTAPGDQRNPAVGGGIVAWEERDATDSDVAVKDLSTGRQKTLASGDDNWQDSPAVGDGTVVWSEDDGSGDSDVRGYDLAKDTGLEVGVGSGDQYAPTVGGRVAVWVHETDGNKDVRGKDLATGEAFVVFEGPGQQDNPAASGGTVIWETRRDGDDGFGTFDLRGARLDLAPEAPADLAATGSAGGVELDWRANAEDDLAGYNVYRASSEGGEYRRLNTNGPIPASAFSDAGAPKGARSYYRVTAVDVAESESAAARANAVVPEAAQLTLSASPAVLDYTLPGSSTKLSGSLASGGSPISGKKVILESKPLGSSTFAPVAGGELTTDAGGDFSLAGLKPAKNTGYRARFVSDVEEIQSATSPTAAVEVKLLVNTGLSATRVKLGGAVRVSGSVFPVNTGTVTFDITRNGAPLISIPNVRLESSRFSQLYRPSKTGLYTVTVTLTGYPRHLVSATARAFRVTVR